MVKIALIRIQPKWRHIYFEPIKSKTSSVPARTAGIDERVYKYTIPETRKALDGWRAQAETIPNEELRTQALASLRDKQFHCEGGTVYALADMSNRHILIPLIVSYQTISDYLDNLCDRSTSMDPADFRLLHQSMLDAVDPEATPVNYYALREDQDDGGYLRNLVTTCQELTSSATRICVSQAPNTGSGRPIHGPAGI